MDNIIKSHANNPDLEGSELTTESDIADKVLNGEIDYTAWAASTDYRLAVAFNELVATYASFEFDDSLSIPQNRSELMLAMTECMRKNIEYMAKCEVIGREAGFKTLLE